MNKRTVLNHVKNIPGWRTTRRLVVINVDDYGNVRLASRTARTKLEHAGVIGSRANRFDCFDTLETHQDLEALFEVLTSVNDVHGRPAVITAYTLSANPDFDRILKEKSGYQYELLPTTFDRLAVEQPKAYAGTWNLWNEGMEHGLLRPQFHGREHINLEIFQKKLDRRDHALLENLDQSSLAGLGPESGSLGVGFTAAFGVCHEFLHKQHQFIIKEGLNVFKKVFGFRSLTFTPPAQQLHPDLYPFIETQGVVAIDKPLRCRRHLGAGKYIREFGRLGRNRGQEHLTIVRNVVFEPTEDRGYNPIEYAISQVKAAFFLRKPAIISSHRVNFCGHINPDNRTQGLEALRLLLHAIVRRWPDVEFISADQLAQIMAKSYT